MKSYFGLSARLLHTISVFSLMFCTVMLIATTFSIIAQTIINNAENAWTMYNVQYAANLYTNGYSFVFIAALVNLSVMAYKLFGLSLTRLDRWLSNYHPLEVCYDLIVLAAYIGVAGLIILLLTNQNGLAFDLLIYCILIGMLYPLALRLVKHVNSTVQFTLPGGIVIE